MPTGHVYGDAGIYQVVVSVKDQDGHEATKAFSLTITDVPATIDFVPDKTITAGTPVDVGTITFHDPGFGDLHTATIFWDDSSSDVGVVNEIINSCQRYITQQWHHYLPNAHL